MDGVRFYAGNKPYFTDVPRHSVQCVKTIESQTETIFVVEILRNKKSFFSLIGFFSRDCGNNILSAIFFTLRIYFKGCHCFHVVYANTQQSATTISTTESNPIDENNPTTFYNANFAALACHLYDIPRYEMQIRTRNTIQDPPTTYNKMSCEKYFSELKRASLQYRMSYADVRFYPTPEDIRKMQQQLSGNIVTIQSYPSKDKQSKRIIITDGSLNRDQLFMREMRDAKSVIYGACTYNGSNENDIIKSIERELGFTNVKHCFDGAFEGLNSNGKQVAILVALEENYDPSNT